ncbi:hypothetical protein CFR78_05470 [Komagataeibacter rhaeticus]|nr:hypothetical protein CFR78_05470 [Komagataeibacter rhaeticus]
MAPDRSQPIDAPFPPPPPLQHHGRPFMARRTGSIRQGILKMHKDPPPETEKQPTPAQKHEDEGRDEALDESFPASDPPAQGRTTEPNRRPGR